MISKIIILLIGLSCVVGQTVTATCAEFDPNKNQSSMRMEMNGNNVNIVMGKCPQGKKPGKLNQTASANLSQGLPLMGCNDAKKKGENCESSYADECETGICIQNACSTEATSGSCSKDTDCADGYYCKDGTVTKSLNKGDACVGKIVMECYKGGCNKNTKTCDTYLGWYLSLDLPALIGGDSTGFKTCTTATVNTDCQYNVSGVTKSANTVGASCISTTLANPVQYFCEMGGGEEQFRKLVKSLDKNYNRRRVFESIPLIGRAANYAKNAVSCATGVENVPSFISQSGFSVEESSFASPFAMSSLGFILGVILLIFAF